MAVLTESIKTDLYRFFAVAFNAAPGTVYMGQMVAAVESGMSVQQVVNEFTSKSQFTDVYPTYMSNANFAAKLVDTVVRNAATDAAKAEAAADIVAALANGDSRSKVIYTIFGKLATLGGDAKWGGVAEQLANQVSAAMTYTEVFGGNSVDPAVLRAALNGNSSSLSLTTGADDLSGGFGNDVFGARVVQNAAGEQTNQLATGDKIHGGGGVDTLNAVVQTATALGSISPGAGIAPVTQDVEIANFTALEAQDGSWGPGDQRVLINAKEMLGLDKVGSVNSDVDVVVHNLTTLQDDGVYANRRLTETMTVRMDHTGNGEAVDEAADLTVLFDQDYLLSRSDILSGGTMTIELMDMDSALTGGDPLLDNPYGEIIFTVNGVNKTLTFGTAADTYVALEAAVVAAISAAGQTDAFFKQLSVSRVPNGFIASDTDGLPGGSTRGDTIVITNSGSEVMVAVSMKATGSAPAGKDFHTNFDATPPGASGFLITANVELEKVGRGADGGDLTVGGMSTPPGDANAFMAGEQYKSVEQFNVTVSGDSTQWSSLASMQSTNNRLEVVNVRSASGSTADLIIGNSETEERFGSVNGAINSDDDLTSLKNSGLKDVRAFDSTAFANDVELHAYISDEVQAKYLDEADEDDDATADNVSFEYSFGGGDDVFNVNVSKANLTMDNAATSEDFVLAVNMGDGDNHFQGQIGDGAVGHWYINLVLNAVADDTPTELSVVAGSGADTVEVWGSGRWNIDTGAGHDAIYSDNSGNQVTSTFDATVDVEDSGDSNFNSGRAVWVLNATGASMGRNIDNLVSDGIENNGSFYRAYLKVGFAGYEGAEIRIDGFNTTDTDLNNAIKRAITSDVHLSKLLVAEDGPAGTLVVRSLVDGEFVVGDFSFSMRAPTLAEFGAMSSAQLVGFNAANGTNFSTAAAAHAKVVADIGTFFAAGNSSETDYGSIFANEDGLLDVLNGANSSAHASNVIEAGLGWDTVSLSTSPNAFEVVNVADGANDLPGSDVEDLVVNATNALITYDADDLIITSTGNVISSITGDTVLLLGGEIVDAIDASATANYDAVDDTVYYMTRDVDGSVESAAFEIEAVDTGTFAGLSAVKNMWFAIADSNSDRTYLYRFDDVDGDEVVDANELTLVTLMGATTFAQIDVNP